jgi:TatD DNase family protein
MLEQHPSACVGEVGLDYAEKALDPKDQDTALLSQLHVAARLMRPVFIHCRRAWDALLRVLAAAGPLPRGFMIHSYSGSIEMIPRLVAIGAHFSFSGSITLSHNRRGRASAAAVPSDRLLIETDAPDIPPLIANIGRPDFTEPRHLVHVLEALAALRNMPSDVLADITWRNACRFFLQAQATRHIAVVGNSIPRDDAVSPQ